MTITVDREKMLQSLLEDDFIPSGPLAVPPSFTITLRKHPESDAEKLPAMTAVLIRYIQELDRNLGGLGVHFDPAGTVETNAQLTIRLVVVPVGDFSGRIDAISNALARLASQVRQELVTRQDADINAKIAAELGSPVTRDVREAAEHLEPVAV